MVSKLHQHAILTGTINSYCLACDSFLRTVKEASLHIEKTIHQKNLDLAVYSDKFPGEGIRKVKIGYYCEHCNIILPIVNKASLHIAERSHMNNKGCNSLKSEEGDMIAFEHVLIKERIWHGIMDDICLVCNLEFDYEDLHKSSSAHSLNLVQKAIEFSKNNGIYRQIDESSFHCFTCDKVLPQTSVTSHFDDSEHKAMYDKCRVVKDTKQTTSGEKPAGTKQSDTGKATVNASNGSTDSGKAVVYNNTKHTTSGEKPAVTEQSDTGKATVNASNGSTDSGKAVVDNNTAKSKTVAVVDTNNNTGEAKPDKDDPVKFASVNKISYNNSNANAYCRICEKRFPSSLTSMKEHVAGGPHIKKMAQINAQPKYTKEPMKQFVKTAFNIESLFQEEAVVNEKYCLTFLSFLMITRNDSGLRCQACEVNINRHDDDVRSHSKISRHERSMSETPVITSITGEFIREVRSGMFHCGFCNLVIGAWEVINDHLKSSEHKDKKDSAKWRLERHLPSIVEHKKELAQREMFMRMMMYRNLFN